jgi:hypothetical protein
VYFTPDTLEQAINQKFVVCLHCNTGWDEKLWTLNVKTG